MYKRPSKANLRQSVYIGKRWDFHTRNNERIWLFLWNKDKTVIIMAFQEGVYVTLNNKGLQRRSVDLICCQRFCYLSKAWCCTGKPSSILVSYSICDLMIIILTCLALITVYIMVPQAYIFSLRSRPMRVYLIFLPDFPTYLSKVPSPNLSSPSFLPIPTHSVLY